jgi:hypothetical protein
VSNLHAFERFHMGIALLALSGFFKTFSGSQNPKISASAHSTGRLHPSWATRPHLGSTNVQKIKPSSPKVPCLKVLRVRDAADGPQTTGRMVISGRMADVCAELDRLAALEMRHLSH